MTLSEFHALCAEWVYAIFILATVSVIVSRLKLIPSWYGGIVWNKWEI